MNLPFKEIIKGNEKVRIFSDDISQDELGWHLDKNDRDVTVLEAGENWGVQFDNELPRILKKGEKFTVPANIYHRVMRGKDNLVIKIKEII